MIPITLASESVGSNEVNERERSIQKASLQVKSFAENMDGNIPWELATTNTGWAPPDDSLTISPHISPSSYMVLNTGWAPPDDSLTISPHISPSSYMVFPDLGHTPFLFNNSNAGNGQSMTWNTSHSQSASHTTQWSNEETISLLSCFNVNRLQYPGIKHNNWDCISQTFNKNGNGYNRTIDQIKSKMTSLARDFGNWMTERQGSANNTRSQVLKVKWAFFSKYEKFFLSVFPNKHKISSSFDRTPEFSATEHAQGSSKKRKQSHTTSSTCNEMVISDASVCSGFGEVDYLRLLRTIRDQIDLETFANALGFAEYVPLRQIFLSLDEEARISWTVYLKIKKAEILQCIDNKFDLTISSCMESLNHLFTTNRIELESYALASLKLVNPSVRRLYGHMTEDEKIPWCNFLVVPHF